MTKIRSIEIFMRLHAQLTAVTVQLQREQGQALAEYALLIGLIAVVVVVAVKLLGTDISSVFNSVAGKI
jgi:pilus assembly protein Flp/PilA